MADDDNVDMSLVLTARKTTVSHRVLDRDDCHALASAAEAETYPMVAVFVCYWKLLEVLLKDSVSGPSVAVDDACVADQRVAGWTYSDSNAK